MTIRPGSRAPYLALIVVQVLFASNAIVGRLVLATVPAGLLVGCRVVGAAFALGMAVSFAVALATVRWLLVFVQSHTFRGFAIYRIVAGALIAFLPAAWWSE